MRTRQSRRSPRGRRSTSQRCGRPRAQRPWARRRRESRYRRPPRHHIRCARKTRVDRNLRIGNDPIFFLRCGRVVALVGDDAGHVAPHADADQNLLRGERALWHASEPLKAHQAVRLDLADDETELVHVGKQHHARPRCVARRRRDQIAEHVGLRREAEGAHFAAEPAPDTALVPAQPGDGHQFEGQRSQPFARRGSV